MFTYSNELNTKLNGTTIHEFIINDKVKVIIRCNERAVVYKILSGNPIARQYAERIMAEFSIIGYGVSPLFRYDDATDTITIMRKHYENVKK